MTKIVKDKDLPARHREITDMRRNFVSQVFPELWDSFLAELMKFEPLVGNDILSQITSMISELTAHFIAQSMAIANADDAGVNRQDLYNGVMTMVANLLETKTIYKIEIPNDLSHIKRI